MRGRGASLVGGAVAAGLVLTPLAAFAAEAETAPSGPDVPADDVPADDVATTVTVRPGEPTDHQVRPSCNDVVLVYEVVTDLVLTRTGDLSTPLEVDIEEAGPAVPDEDHEPLPDTVTFAAGEADRTVSVTPLPSDTVSEVELEVRLLAADGYEVAQPDRADLRFVRAEDPDAPASECGFRIAGGPQLQRDTAVGGRPDAVLVEGVLAPAGFQPLPSDAYVVEVIGGELPSGLTLAADGTFGGAAATPGRRTATIEACRTGEPGTCETATLTVVVAAAATTPPVDDTEVLGKQLPATGPEGSLFALGLGQLLAGGLLLRRTRSRDA